MIEAVVSDFGGVLTTPLMGAYTRIQDDVDVPLDAYAKAFAHSMERDGEHPLYALERGEITEAEFLARLERGVAAVLGRAVPLHGFGERLMSALHPNSRLLDYYRRLRSRGIRLAMCTNNVREWEPLWRAKLPEIEELFEVVVDSAFVGLRKPEPQIYELTLQRLGNGIRGEQCLFLDDLEVNCDAARALGMTAVRFVSAEQAIAELESALTQ
jgi:epoxide hydrolase-like predicted phosphatase